MRTGVTVCLMFVMACGQTACADELIFTNGDSLKGKIKQLAEGKVIFESEVAGSITVDFSQIKTFKTDEAVEVHLADGAIFEQVILESGPGLFAIKGDSVLKQQEFGLDSITSINPPPKPKPRWTGDVSAGVTATRGNTVVDTSNVSVNLTKRTERDRITLGGYYIKGEQEDPSTGEKMTTEDTWWMRGKYDYYFTKKVYGYGEGRYEKDAIALLDRRVIVGGGFGYQWIESEDMNFSTEAGLASLYENFDNQTDSSTEVSAQLGYHFDKKLHDKIKFINDLTYYPSLGKVSDYFLTVTAEIRASVTERVFTNFRVIFDYDTTPARGKGSTDVKYIFGGGVSF
jgi:putative salt-induced outer membrane protein YdiY